MLSPKNITPRELAFLTALALAIPISLLVLAIERRWQPVVFAFFVVLIGGFILIWLVIERFIYRKIKLIYKLIYKTKATKREETYYKYILPRKSIDEVRIDVETWATQNQQELDLLRATEQYRKEFLQNLSHEFKTPVFAIQGYIETLLAGAKDNPEICERFLNKTTTNIERLTNLLNDLDEISRLERGELALQKQNFVIQDLIKDAFSSLYIMASPKQITTAIKKGCEAPLTVHADKEKIRQVLLNLTENAIKYGKQGGHITASIYLMDGHRILVEISDDGIGIEEKHLSRIFERFFRTDTGRSLDVTGSGLGLAICKHIIEAHGQTVHVRSRENVGTTIGFTLDGKKD